MGNTSPARRPRIDSQAGALELAQHALLGLPVQPQMLQGWQAAQQAHVTRAQRRRGGTPWLHAGD